MEEVNWGKVKLENEIQILMEEIECVNDYLDDKLVPRQNDNGKDYSIIGRIKRLEERFQKLLSELESNYLTITNQSKMEQTAIQELIAELKVLKQTKVLMHSLNAIDDCIHLAYAKLEMEKKQIIMSLEYGSGLEIFHEYDGEQYYNETFKSV